MKRYLPFLFVLCLVACDANVYIGAAKDAVNQSEPAIVAVEDATGATLPEGVSSKGEQITSAISTAAKAGAAVSGVIPGGQAVSGILLGLSGLAGALAAMFRRRATKAKAVAKAVMIGADELNGAGEAITAEARARGCADDVEAMYREVTNG